MEEIVTFEDLYAAYKDCIKHKKHSPNASEFVVNENKNLYELYEDLNKGTYKIGRSICFLTEFPVWREVFAASFRDRVVQHLVINKIYSYIDEELINNTFSCRKNKGVLYGINILYDEARQLSENFTKEIWVFKGDLQSYFMTIDKNKLFEKTVKLINKHDIFSNEKEYEFYKKLIKDIIFNCPQHNCLAIGKIKNWKESIVKKKTLFGQDDFHGLPIGNVTSQVFSNIYLNDFDHFVIDELGLKHYGRYCDDFYILANTKEEILEAIPKIKNKLKKDNVTLHPNKIYIQSFNKGIRFIGGVIKPNRIYISNKTKNKLFKMLRMTQEYIENNDITIEEFDYWFNSMNSYLGLMSHFATFNIRKKCLKGKYYLKLNKLVYTTDKFKKIIKFKETKKITDLSGLNLTDEMPG